MDWLANLLPGPRTCRSDSDRRTQHTNAAEMCVDYPAVPALSLLFSAEKCEKKTCEMIRQRVNECQLECVSVCVHSIIQLCLASQRVGWVCVCVSSRTRTRIFNLKLRFFSHHFFLCLPPLKRGHCAQGWRDGVGSTRYTVWQNSFEPGSTEAVNALTDLQTFYLLTLGL